MHLNILVTEDTRAILKAVLDRDGVMYGAQVDRAVRLWAKEKGIEVSHGVATSRRTAV